MKLSGQKQCTYSKHHRVHNARLLVTEPALRAEDLRVWTVDFLVIMQDPCVNSDLGLERS
jgi:hypothetical protein